MEKIQLGHRLFFKEFIEQYHITLSNEDRYNLYRFLSICNEIRNDIYDAMLQDSSLLSYGLPRKHMVHFRLICNKYRTKVLYGC